MKNILTLFALLFFCQAKAQYIPMNLDTSCFWVNKFYHYDGFSGAPLECRGETISYVSNDTIINNKLYYRIVTYIADITYQTNYFCNSKFLYHPIVYISEDSALSTTYRIIYDTTTAFQYNFNSTNTDSINFDVSNQNIPIDSISNDTYNSIPRKTLHCTFGFGNDHLKIIEGIGATINFPATGYGEWGIPYYNLICYSKQGQILYGDTLQPCIKKPPVPVSINDIEKLNFNIYSKNNQIIIDNAYNKNFDCIAYDLMGKILFKAKIENGMNSFDINSNSNIVIIKIVDKKNVITKKIFLNN